MTTKINTYGIRFSVKLIIAALIFMASASYSHSQCTVTPSSDWKNTIDFPYDSLMNYTGSFEALGWIKFTILLCDPDTVY
ncbi:MAG: hypothetical protein GY795_46425, partial [Desulfobacterales bacterium]|nr:hypothetical protein [Desulfobacterales bacterium]